MKWEPPLFQLIIVFLTRACPQFSLRLIREHTKKSITLKFLTNFSNLVAIARKGLSRARDFRPDVICIDMHQTPDLIFDCLICQESLDSFLIFVFGHKFFQSHIPYLL